MKLSGGNATGIGGAILVTDEMLTLDTGAVLSFATVTGSTATATYTVAAGETSPDLTVSAISLSPGATLRNSLSNNAPLTLPVNNIGTTADIIVNPMAPTTVTNVSVNVGNAQRSRITTITLKFNNPVTAASYNTLGAITLTRTAAASSPTGSVGDVVQTGPAGLNHITVTQGSPTSLVLTFDNDGLFNTSSFGVENGSLSDGYWRLQVGSYQTPLNDLNLRRLFGDSTGEVSGTVNAVDLTSFGNDSKGTSPVFDFNNDGVVNSVDLTAFGNRFGNVL